MLPTSQGPPRDRKFVGCGPTDMCVCFPCCCCCCFPIETGVKLLGIAQLIFGPIGLIYTFAVGVSPSLARGMGYAPWVYTTLTVIQFLITIASGVTAVMAISKKTVEAAMHWLYVQTGSLVLLLLQLIWLLFHTGSMYMAFKQEAYFQIAIRGGDPNSPEARTIVENIANYSFTAFWIPILCSAVYSVYMVYVAWSLMVRYEQGPPSASGTSVDPRAPAFNNSPAMMAPTYPAAAPTYPAASGQAPPPFVAASPYPQGPAPMAPTAPKQLE
uniref:Transmembrane protein n=1 Tax=Chromera velia CCMP2878 TaxID=1169474 RepID=A0A0G4I4V0_9ALVE|eukprot:Cvel_11018.t1-p1 / transcript=Cvel_11018.t1 / gene=Cvel_11018 / organism=Chromera_velia_CCMP2878 / gene_product=hypothetical protein / transcript_product=hypothetical protein / location=Cvel_scaffold679:53273-54082(-) / protein_length=270 / sequence_SO=supercontig / SO=protein_coding / is_pseudo=false